jgi:hypothetical protein
MSIFSTFKGNSHWFRCSRIIVVFISSSASLSYFTFTAMTSRWPICCRFIIPSKATTRCCRRSSPFDHLSNNIIPPEMKKVPQPQRAAIAFHDGGTLILFNYTRLCGNTLCATARKTKGRCIQRATPLPVSGWKAEVRWLMGGGVFAFYPYVHANYTLTTMY